MQIFASMIAIIALLLPAVPQANCSGNNVCDCCASASEILHKNKAQKHPIAMKSCCHAAIKIVSKHDACENTTDKLNSNNRCNCQISSSTQAVLQESFTLYAKNHSPSHFLNSNPIIFSYPLSITPEQTYLRGHEPPGIHISISTTVLRI